MTPALLILLPLTIQAPQYQFASMESCVRAAPALKQHHRAAGWSCTLVAPGPKRDR